MSENNINIKVIKNNITTQRNLNNISVNMFNGNSTKGEKGNNSSGGNNLTYKVGDLGGIGSHRVVYLDQNNNLQYSTNLDIIKSIKTIGITIQAGNYLDDIIVVNRGEIKDFSFNFDVDKLIYLGNNGLLTQTYPTSPALCSLVLGFATNTNTIFVDIKQIMLFN